MITIARIDERLIHGQVAYAWTVEYKSQAVMVIDDEVSKDSFQKTLLEMACPKDLKCFVVGKEKAAELLKKYETKKIFVVVKDPAVLLYLIENGIQIESINVGGLYFKEGRTQIAKTIYLDEKLTETFRKLHELGVELETRTTPRDAKTDLMTMI